MNDIVAGLRRYWEQHGAGAPFAVEHGPGLAGEQQRSVIDSSKIAQALGWRAEMALDAGLERTVESFRNPTPAT